MKKGIFIFCILLASAVVARAEITLGLGYGSITIPSNSGLYGYVAADGENTGTPFIYINKTKPYGFGCGLSLSGYLLEKKFAGYTYKWKPVFYSIYANYQIPLSKNDISPLLSLRAGGTIAPISYDAKYESGSTTRYKSDSETKFGPYIGADIQIPFEKTNFMLLFVLEKSFITSSLLQEDVNMGPFIYGIGVGYRFS